MEIIYRADDGTEFRNQTDCLLHERMSNLSHNKVINVKIAFFDVTKKLAKKYYNEDLDESDFSILDFMKYVELIVYDNYSKNFGKLNRLKSEMEGIIHKSKHSDMIMRQFDFDKARRKAEIRHNFADVLSKYEGDEIAKKLEFTLWTSDLCELAKLHKADCYRTQIEDLLTTDNYHELCSRFAKGDYYIYAEQN